MSNSFLFAFTVTAGLAAGAVDFVNQTNVTGGISVQEYLTALPARVGGHKGTAETAAPELASVQPASAPSGQTADKEVLRQQMALAASQIAAAAATAEAGQPVNAEAAAGAASFLGALMKSMGKASGQKAAAEEPIHPADAAPAAPTIKVNAIGLGGCASTGSGKRCKIGG